MVCHMASEGTGGAMSCWDENTLYEEHSIFGVGMSGWSRMGYWKHREQLDIDLFRQWDMTDLYILELID